MSIRVQLLIVALTTLILPWAGCQYAGELENALRGSQERALEASADTIAHALAAEPARAFGDLRERQPFDGYREDWDVAADPVPLAGAAGASASSRRRPSSGATTAWSGRRSNRGSRRSGWSPARDTISRRECP